MYPFEDRRTWILANRYRHVLEIAKDVRLRGKADAILRERLETMERWLKVRLGVVVLLVIGSIVTVVSLIVEALRSAEAGAVADAAAGVEALLMYVARIAGSVSGLLAAAWFALNRLLGQLEVDVLGLLIVRRGTGPKE